MAFFARCPGDFAPLFQLLDDYDMHRSARPSRKVKPARTYSPRFDVYELNDRYYLDGELPGVDQSNIQIEFTDPHTLVIKGRSERKYHRQAQQQSDDTDSSDETSSVKSLQPTVEDWDEMSDSPVPESTPAPAPASKEKAPEKTSKPAHKYWISERSVGEFNRTFTFPTRVDQDSVRASLRDGILSVVVPKEPAPMLKKIRIE